MSGGIKRPRVEIGPQSWDLSSRIVSPDPSPKAGPWTSENDPVSFFLTHDPVHASIGLSTAIYESSESHALARANLDAFESSVSSMGSRCVKLADAVMAHTQDPDFLDFLCSLITVTEAGPEDGVDHHDGGDHERLTYDELSAFKRAVVLGMTPSQVAHSISNHTEILVRRDPAGLTTIASYTVTPMPSILSDRMHICTPLGFAIARSRSKRHSLRLLSYVLRKIGLPRIRTVPMPLRMSGCDYVPLGPELALFGTGRGTDEATVRYLLDDDALGAGTVAMVRNLFDRSEEARETLERVVKFIGGTCVLVAECILGAQNPIRRLVCEFRRVGGPRTDLGGPLSGAAYAADAKKASANATAFPPMKVTNGDMDPGVADEDPSNFPTSQGPSRRGSQSHPSSKGSTSDDASDSESDDQHSHHTYALTRADVELGEYLESIGLDVVRVPDAVFERSGLGVFNTGDGKLLVADEELAAIIKAHPAFKGTVSIAEPPATDGEEWTTGDWFRHVRAHSMVFRKPSPDTTARFRTCGGDGLRRTPNRLGNHGEDDDSLTAGPGGIGDYFQPPRGDTPQQSTSTVLMVAPVGFARNEETAKDNQYMRKTELHQDEIERRALSELSRAHLELVSRGVKVMLFSAERFHRTPDACFPNNWMSTHPSAELDSSASTLVLYPMATVSRRAERRENVVSALQSMYDREVSFVQWEAADFPHFLEGTGVLILDRVHRVAYATLSQRCYRRISETWARKMGYDLCLFTMTDEHGVPCYHTNVMMAMGTSCAVVCLEAIADPVQRADVVSRIRATKREIVDITRAQVEQFCGNVLEVKDGEGRPMLVMSRRARAAFTPEQVVTLKKNFHDLVAVPVETIEDIGGGGIRCMLGEIF